MRADDPKKFPVRTVQAECIVSNPSLASYCISGVRQRAGDKARMPLGEAQDLARRGKARIVPGTEKMEML
ncbi:MAG: hypothetical protein ACYDAX_10215 [Desulfobacteria bacterium]